MDKIAVLIPCYNEELTIAKVVSDAKKHLPEAAIYVYDNNSTDKTAEEALKAGAIVRKEPRQGKGNVVRTMFREIDAEVYVMVDGDDTYGLELAPEMVRRVLDGDDMVVGDRLSGAYYQENRRAFHNFGNDLVRFQINHLFHANIKDIMTGLRAFSYEFVKTFYIQSKGFEIETEMSAHAADKNLRVSSLPITYRAARRGAIRSSILSAMVSKFFSRSAISSGNTAQWHSIPFGPFSSLGLASVFSSPSSSISSRRAKSRASRR